MAGCIEESMPGSVGVCLKRKMREKGQVENDEI